MLYKYQQKMDSKGDAKTKKKFNILQRSKQANM